MCLESHSIVWLHYSREEKVKGGEAGDEVVAKDNRLVPVSVWNIIVLSMPIVCRTAYVTQRRAGTAGCARL